MPSRSTPPPTLPLRLPLRLTLGVLLALALAGCKARPATTSATASAVAEDLPPDPTPAPADAWLPADCMAAPVPNNLHAYDCDDGSSFTARAIKDGVTASALLEDQWHEALSLLEIAGATVQGSTDATCRFEGNEAACRVVRARSGDVAARYVVAAVTRDGRMLAVDCVDLSGGAALHPVCARFLAIEE